MTDRDAVLANLQQILRDSFEINPELVVPEADLYEDLQLDSIDAIDLIVSVQELIGRKVQPEQFKSARRIDDVVTIVCQLIDG